MHLLGAYAKVTHFSGGVEILLIPSSQMPFLKDVLGSLVGVHTRLSMYLRLKVYQ